MITFNGFTSDEILALPDDVLQKNVVSGKPMVFKAGTADVLGRFWVERGSIVLELGHIDGGGEGVLPALAVLALRYERRSNLESMEWRVHAVTCKEPNLKLRHLLERRGFRLKDIPDTGLCYHLVQAVDRK